MDNNNSTADVDLKKNKDRSFKHVFVDRESPLTPVLESPAGLWTFGLIILISFFAISYNVSFYFLDGGVSWKEDRDVFVAAFAGMSTATKMWFYHLGFCVFVMYPLVNMFWKLGALLNIVTFLLNLGMLAVSAYVAFVTEGMGPATKLFLSYETVRLGMKIQNYSREMIDLNVASAKSSSKQPNTSLTHYFYFLFCPTALYRPSYPRRQIIDWRRVAYCSYSILVLMFFGLKLVQIMFLPLKNVGKEAIEFNTFIRSFYWSTFISGFYSLVVFAFGWQHCWQNLMAELMGFADRQFYLEYYRVSSFDKFFVTWNKVIQGWLYETHLSPLRSIVGKTMAALLIMLYSGFVHDYVYIYATTCLLPFYFMQMPFMVFISASDGKGTPPLRSFMIFHLIHLSEGVVHMLIALEYYSRINCKPVASSPLADLMMPRFPSCLEIKY